MTETKYFREYTDVLEFIQEGLLGLSVSEETKNRFIEKVSRLVKRVKDLSDNDVYEILIQNALPLVEEIKNEDGYVTPETLGNANWSKFARYVFLHKLYREAAKNRGYNPEDKYGDFYDLVVKLVDKGLYTKELLENYSKEELIEAGKTIQPQKDELFDYAGLYSLYDRYLVKDYDGSLLELPQERFMVVALHLMMIETENRMEKVKELYWAVSNHYLTLATPTLGNGGRAQGGLSSCFVIATGDSLREIYDDNTDVATFSKNGAGIGIYFGKLRADGSDIRGIKGASSGIIGWVKQIDNTATYVDQLGTRKGAVTVYLDVWHKDVETFIDLRLNTGDSSKRAYRIYTGLCIPDEFMRQVEKRGKWYLFDPHEIRKVMGFSLEDYYDEKRLKDGETPNPKDHAFTYRYYQCVNNPQLSKVEIPAIELMKRIMMNQLENGMPFMFYRDTVNRHNPNKHAGIIYSSNLCTEIAQNMSPSYVTEETIDWDTGEVIVKKHIGDLVTCNLSSLVLNNIMRDGVLERVINIQVRALDNVISLMRVPVPQAQYTNLKYRAIGAGEQGIAALLAAEGIRWDSEEAIEYIKKLEEDIMYYTIKASALLGKEKGSYPAFEGSQWQTGEWFEVRGLTEGRWAEVKELASQAMRNGYLRAIAPTGFTSILAGSTAGIDPIFDVVYYERKNDYQIPIVVPNLTPRTWFYYRPTVRMSYNGEPQLAHMWSIRHGEVRQVFVDQAISSNFYIPKTIKATNFLTLHMEAWKRGIKTTYYIRSWNKNYEDECLACSS